MFDQFSEWFELALAFGQNDPGLVAHVASGVIVVMVLAAAVVRRWRARRRRASHQKTRSLLDEVCTQAGPPMFILHQRDEGERLLILARHAIESMKEVALKAHEERGDSSGEQAIDAMKEVALKAHEERGDSSGEQAIDAMKEVAGTFIREGFVGEIEQIKEVVLAARDKD